MVKNYKWPEDKDKLIMHQKYFVTWEECPTLAGGDFLTWYGYFRKRSGKKVENITKVTDPIQWYV